LFEKNCGKWNTLAQTARCRAQELDLRHRLEATSADVEPHATAALHDRRPLDVRPELTLGLTLRETYIVAAHRPLATYFTFSHNFTLPDAGADGVQIKGDQSVATNFNIIKNNPLL
jgi:hypothetical protein